MPLLYHAYVYLEFLILACTIYILAPEVLKPIDNVTISEIAPAFEQVGGGIQYELPNNIKKLKELDYIKEIK